MPYDVATLEKKYNVVLPARVKKFVALKEFASLVGAKLKSRRHLAACQRTGWPRVNARGQARTGFPARAAARPQRAAAARAVARLRAPGPGPGVAKGANERGPGER